MNMTTVVSSKEQHATKEAAQSSVPSTVREKPVQRNIAVDAYRGLVMFLMMGEVMRLADVYRAYPASLFWRILAFNQTHVEWSGMGLHDMIQPSFTFLVGVAMPYSIASRIRKGQTFSH